MKFQKRLQAWMHVIDVMQEHLDRVDQANKASPVGTLLEVGNALHSGFVGGITANAPHRVGRVDDHFAGFKSAERFTEQIQVVQTG